MSTDVQLEYYCWGHNEQPEERTKLEDDDQQCGTSLHQAIEWLNGQPRPEVAERAAKSIRARDFSS